MRKKIVQEKKLDKNNKLVIIKEHDEFKVVSLKKSVWLGWLIGWRPSDFSFQGITDLKGQNIVDGYYQSFTTLNLAKKWMDFQASRYGKRIKFISH